jgi:hypothetical protein
MMNIELLNGIPFYLNEPRMALDFLVEKLGFVIYGPPASKNLDDLTIRDNRGNCYRIFSVTRKDVSNKNEFQRIIHTTDCLSEFYNMYAKGFMILNKPQYVPQGLAFEVLDPWGNRYTFLEKRDYSD